MGFNDFSSSVKLNNIKAYGGVNTATNNAFKTQIYSDIEEIDYDVKMDDETQETHWNFFSGTTGNKSNKTINNKIWSSFYGGAAKHTKDHLGMAFNSLLPGALKLDKYDREISYDKDGNKYKKGIYKKVDEDGGIVEKKSKLAQIRDWNTEKINKITNGKFTLLGDSIKEFQKGQQIYGLDGKGTGIYKGGGLDDKIANSKLGRFIDNYNTERRKLSKFGSDNQYRLGQNWAYGSATLYSDYKTAEWNAASYKNDWGDENLNASVEADFIHAECKAGYEGGPDHIMASASADFSIFHGELEGGAKLENLNTKYGELESLGANGKLECDVAHAYANAKVGAGLYKDEFGKIRLDAGIQGSVGADLCSASATGTATILGTNISGTATVKVGIGAQANIGFEDGKLNFHLGLALGVGVELGFSLDTSQLTSVIFGAALDEAKKIPGVNEAVNWVSGWFD